MPIPSVNYHIWEPCNMRCRFCFATFQDVKAELPWNATKTWGAASRWCQRATSS